MKNQVVLDLTAATYHKYMTRLELSTNNKTVARGKIIKRQLKVVEKRHQRKQCFKRIGI